MIARRHLLAGLVAVAVAALPVPAFARRRRRFRSSGRASPSPSRSEAYFFAVAMIVLGDRRCPASPELVDFSPAVRELVERFGVSAELVSADLWRACELVLPDR